MHISLTPQLEAIVKDKVNSGLYNNASEVVREALRLMQRHDDLHQLKRDRLRQEIALGLDSANRDAFSHQTIDEIVAEARFEKYGE